MMAENSRAHAPSSIREWFILCQLVALNFLALDFLRRLSDALQSLPLSTLAINAGIVGSLASAGSFLTALALYRLNRFRPGVAGPCLFFVFYSVNLLFAKFRLVPDVAFLDLRVRYAVSVAALLLAIPIGLAARGSLTELVRTVRQSKATLAWALCIPFFSLALLGGLWRAVSATNKDEDLAAAVSPPRPNILMVTMDALAAEDMSLYGYERPTTPQLDMWSQEFTVFENAHSASNSTNIAISNFQGFPFKNYRPQDGLAHQLKQLGYSDSLWVSCRSSKFFELDFLDQAVIVHAFEDNVIFKSLHRLYSRQDLTWLASLATEEWPYFFPYHVHAGAEYHQLWTHDHHPAGAALQVAVDHLLEARDQPTFVWVHLIQPHYPYHPVAPFKGRFESGPLIFPPLTGSVYSPGFQDEVTTLRRRYDEYILQLDNELGRMLQKLRTAGALDKTLIVMSADHGEGFTGGFVGHGGFDLPESQVHIPLLIRFPGGKPATRPKTFVSPLDLLPTVLSYLKAKPSGSLPGENMMPYIANPEMLSPIPRLSISLQAYTRGDGQIAVYTGRYKVVFTKKDRAKVEVFDLIADPEATKNIADSFGAKAQAVAESVKW